MLIVRVSKLTSSWEWKRSVRFGKEREESGINRHARMNGKMDEKVSRDLMAGLTAREA